MAIWYASGPYEMAEGEPGSAFTTGDILTYNANSQLSRVANVSGGNIAGIAAAPSDRSVNNKVTYIKPTNDTLFWSDITAGSAVTRGAGISFAYGVHRGQSQFYASSSGSVVGVVERGPAEVEGQSVQSRILFRFTETGGALTHS